MRCSACGAPLLLGEEPPAPALDCALDLDRRRSRTPVPAAAPPPATADLDEGDLGDLSFDAPADDGPWTLASPRTAEEPEPACGAAGADPVEPASQPEASPAVSQWTQPAVTLPPDDPDVELDAGDHDDSAEPTGAGDDHDRARRGRLLSLASLALAGAAALVAVLSSR